jgi:two-component system chemotaxis response regulator CheB
MRMIRVLVVDDSPTARVLLTAILGSDPNIQVVGQAADGFEAVVLTGKLRPDVVTMDLRMPGMDGLEATKEIMITAPTPILIVTSSVVAGNVETSMHTLRAGALAVLAKPSGPGSPDFDDCVQQLLTHIKALSQVKVVRRWRQAADRVRADSRPRNRPRAVALAASTGGPAALHCILTALPRDFPVPLLIVQHITHGFSRGLADWLSKECDLHVKLADPGEKLAPRTAYLAPDDCHLGATRDGCALLDHSPPVGGFRPSGTFLFESLVRAFGPAMLAVVLTGMGDDGTAGLKTVKLAGGGILAQDEKSSVIFGMPRAAIQTGLVDHVLPLESIAGKLIELVGLGQG